MRSHDAGMVPSLAIVPGGVRYRVFREAICRLPKIPWVDVRRGAFGGLRLLSWDRAIAACWQPKSATTRSRAVTPGLTHYCGRTR